jgi:hypothetical protein
MFGHMVQARAVHTQDCSTLALGDIASQAASGEGGASLRQSDIDRRLISRLALEHGIDIGSLIGNEQPGVGLRTDNNLVSDPPAAVKVVAAGGSSLRELVPAIAVWGGVAE